MTTWFPLVVALVVAIISAVGSYITALHMSSRAARQELQATKRTAYAKALGDMQAGQEVLMWAKSGKQSIDDEWLIKAGVSTALPAYLSEEEAARLRIDARRQMAQAKAQVLVLGGPALREAIFAVEEMTRAEWNEEGRAWLSRLMADELAAGEPVGLVRKWWDTRRQRHTKPVDEGPVYGRIDD